MKQADVNTLPVGMHLDADGLYLQVRGETSRSWIYRYQFNGKTRSPGLGSTDIVSLEDARKKRDAMKVVKNSGRDPLDALRQEEVAAEQATLNTVTFRQAWDKYVVVARRKWTNTRHAESMPKFFERYIFPTLGDVALVAITRAQVIETFRPIWHRIPKTAGLLRRHVWKTFEHAFALDETLAMRNPADLKPIEIALGELEDATKEGHTALAFEQLPAFLLALRARTATAARALEFTILTAARTNETLGADFREIDWVKKTWAVPPERMKNRAEHVVPLSARAIEILEAQKAATGGKGFIFPGGSCFGAQPVAGAPLSHTSLIQLLRRVHGALSGNLTTHGFRATFKTWGEEATEFDSKLIEKALSHTLFVDTDGRVVGNKVEASYNKGILLDKRRTLMDAWGAFCGSTAPSNVLPLRATAA